MGYTVEAILKVKARINVSADDPREAGIEASACNVLEWEILDEDYEVLEETYHEPNGPDYELDIMFGDVMGSLEAL